tara:strand:+ start:191 stop:1702 length:1512 start_codon:yes stop_codon:yes gene_type:complete
MRLLYIALLLSALSFGQDRNGISYQALILNPQGEQLPGANNNTVPMANTEVCLRFHITTNAGSYNEYSERQVLTTDAYGMINTVVGTGAPVGTIMWNQIVWTEDSKGLKVEIDYSGECSSFVALSSQELTSVPFALYSPASNIPGPPGEAGDSAYQVWIDEGNTGTEQEFLDSLKGTDGEPGDPGADGDSAYQLWLDAGNTGTEVEFLNSLQGEDGNPGDPGNDGKSAYEFWLDAGNTGTEVEFLESLVGEDGGTANDGKSAYEVWIENGNTGTEQEFLDSLVGVPGTDGKTAFELWLEDGNTGTEQDFLAALKGEQGTSAYQTWKDLGNVETEQDFVDSLKGEQGKSAYDIWIEAGNTGTEDDFIEFIKGEDGEDGLLEAGDAEGNTTYWDGSKWVTTSSNLYNDGTNVMIGTTTAEPSSAFTVASTTQGVLLPKMTLSQRDAISNPTSGLLIFQTDNTPGFYYHDGTQWINIASGNNNQGTTIISVNSQNINNTLLYTQGF